ncbi:MAG TPA: CHC2 zinc finger domain-containing protein [Candidatus Paceibacterota bacterium]|nr:CHC2 zinc finger domain-containing protein [Candidatus Paceibacterota bacterium]
MPTEQISVADIKRGLEGINRPFFSEWVRYAYPQGYIDLLSEALLTAGKIKNPVEVIPYMATVLSDDMLKSDKKVYYGDLSRTASCNQQAKKLKEAITGEKISSQNTDKTKRFGTIGHIAIPSLFAGELAIDPADKKDDLSTSLSQGTMFPNDFDYKLLEALPPDRETRAVEKKRKKLTAKLAEKIERTWTILAREMQRSHLPIQSSQYQSLLKDLHYVYGDHMKKVINAESTGFEDEYLYFLTFMTWAAALVYFRERGSTPLFREISVLKNSSDVATGRIDALSVVKIEGKSPTRKQLQRIRHMSKHDFTSIGHIVRALLNSFGRHVELKISDWKFAIGDSPKSMKKKLNIIKKDDVMGGPLPEHERQLKRYLSTTVLSHSLASGFAKLEDVESLWEAESFSLTGELVYFFPDTLPIVHQVALTREEVKEAFQEQVVQSFFPAKRRASLRVASNFAMKFATELVEGKERQIKSQDNTSTQLLLTDGETTQGVKFADTISMESIIRQYHERKFKDRFNLIEIVEKRGKKEYLEMDLSVLAKLVASGDIVAERGFNLRTGGKICCPVHYEKTPSCQISPDIDRFTCFGCGVGGTFNPFTVPQGVEIGVSKGVRWELAELVIPPRHREIMLCAQSILRKSFWGSKAEMYLWVERGLNPWCSYNILEAGFADWRVIAGLLLNGFTFDELVLYGFLGFSPGITVHNRTVKILEKFGYPIERQRRLLDPKENKWGLPYSILEDRLTFPLEVEGVINSIYGRSIIDNCPKQLRHRKLRSKETRMRHGGLNITCATDSTADIMVVEAPLNMATLMETTTDLKALTAIIGVNNPLLVELLARHKGNIITGFDWDPMKWNDKDKKWEGETGQRNTVIFRDRLEEYGFEGNVHDFTSGFVKNHPEVAYNDANQYWQDYGKKVSIYDNLIEIPRTFVEPKDRGVKIPE